MTSGPLKLFLGGPAESKGATRAGRWGLPRSGAKRRRVERRDNEMDGGTGNRSGPVRCDQVRCGERFRERHSIHRTNKMGRASCWEDRVAAGVFGTAGICGSGWLLVGGALFWAWRSPARLTRPWTGRAFFSSWVEKQVSNGLADSSERFIRRQDRGGHLGEVRRDCEHQRIGEGLALFPWDLRFSVEGLLPVGLNSYRGWKRCSIEITKSVSRTTHSM